MKKRFTVTLNEDVVKQVKKKAIDENTNFSAMVEACLEELMRGNITPTIQGRKS